MMVAIGTTTHATSADYGLIQTSIERAHGYAVQWREPFESGITHNQMWYAHGSSGRMVLYGLIRRRPPLHRRRIGHAIGTTTVDTAGIMTTTEEATMAEAAGVEIVFTLRIGAEVRLVAPTLSLTCRAIVEVLNQQYLPSVLDLYVRFVHILHSSNSDRYGCIYILCQQGSSEVVGAAAGGRPAGMTFRHRL